MSETPFSRRTPGRGPLPSRLEAAAAHARRKALESRQETPTRYSYQSTPFAATDLRRSGPVSLSRREHSEVERLRDARSLYRGYADGATQLEEVSEALAREDERPFTSGVWTKKFGRGKWDGTQYQASDRGGETLHRESSELFADQDVDSQDLAFELDRELARLEARQRDLEADRRQEDHDFNMELARLEEELRAEESAPRFDLRTKHRLDDVRQPWLEEALDRDELRDRLPSSDYGPDGDVIDYELKRLSRRLPPQGAEADAF